MQIRTPTDLGALLRERRREMGLSQAALAARVGASRQWVVDLERGKTTVALGLVLRTAAELRLTLRVEASSIAASGIAELGLGPIALGAPAPPSKKAKKKATSTKTTRPKAPKRGASR